jgi:hypothetical protein
MIRAIATLVITNIIERGVYPPNFFLFGYGGCQHHPFFGFKRTGQNVFKNRKKLLQAEAVRNPNPPKFTPVSEHSRFL